MITEKYREPSISKKKKREFEVLVKNNMKRAYFSALGLLGSHDSAMDISQEAFIRAYRNFNKYDPKRKFFTWYYKILKNLCLNFIRDNKSRKEENYLEDKYFDNVLSAEEKNEFEHLLNSNPELKNEFEEQKKIKEVLNKMKLRNPSRDVWDSYWMGVYNKIERGLAWIAISIGALIFFGYASFEAVNAFINDTTTPRLVHG